MALRAAAHMVLVTPTGETGETEHGRIIVVQDSVQKIYRGVIEHVGACVQDPIERGNVLHYTAYHSIADKHIVPIQNVVAFEDDE